jgi:hypothetical protein
LDDRIAQVEFVAASGHGNVENAPFFFLATGFVERTRTWEKPL